ncbi:T9SS type A sorting domain-containing protein [Fulvivirga sp. M361]|uniref:T9SS type A sorting domain-containing protein n=1 Tax=Fulvivirga sp. M361 TaxID=2594266 RepID=UPI001625D258|nr:T9SS type A sorting domain-containing protein [Fulvivirga sp. M361]
MSNYTFSNKDGGAGPSSGVGTSLLKPFDIFDRTKRGAIVINNDLEEDTTFVKGPGFPMGFDFYYDGQYFDRFAASTNGYIKLGTSSEDFTIKRDTLTGAVFEHDFAKERQNIISVFQTDVNTNIPYSHTFNYVSGLGFPGEKKTIVSWYNIYSIGFYEEYPSGSAREIFTQVTLLERERSLRFSYFAGLPFATHIKEVAIGLRGSQLNNNPENLHLRSVVNGINDWTTSEKSANPSAVMDFNQDLLSGNSRTFTFSPPIDNTATPESPVTYFLVPDYYSGSQYGDAEFHYILADQADSISRNPVLGWSPASQLDNTYDVYLSTDYPPADLLVSGVSERRLELPELAPGTTYYIGIVAHNANGSTPLDISSFTTRGGLEYCSPPIRGGLGIIESVELNTLHFQTNEALEELMEFPFEPPYTTTLIRGETYAFRYSESTVTNENGSVYVFIDYNQNGLLSETNTATDKEVKLIGSRVRGGTTEAQITIPEDALLGETRLRVKVLPANISGRNPFDPCISSGLRQDYIITIAPSVSCAGFTMSPQVQPLSCFEAGDGAIDLRLTGGTEPYTITWEKDGQPLAGTTGTQDNLGRGIYRAFVEDAVGCDMQTVLIAVIQPPGLRSTLVEQVDLTCAGDGNGSISLDVSGGTGPYTYLWSNGQTEATATELVEGEYSVTISDAKDCSITSETFTIVAPASLMFSEPEMMSPSCHDASDGSIKISTSGGSGSYTYLWSNGETEAIATELVEGEYSVTVTDIKDCSITSEAFALLAPTPVILSEYEVVSLSCHGESDGRVSTTISGGTGPYTYLWSNGHTEATATALSEGDYTVTVTDAKGCVFISDVFNLTEPAPLVATLSVDDLTEGADLVVEVSGGNSPYNYRWLPEHNEAVLENAAAGEYSVTVSDTNGCTFLLENIVVEANVTTSLEGQAISSFSVYPNPVEDHMTIQFSEPAPKLPWQFSLINSAGKKLWETSAYGTGTRIDVSEVASGTYYLVIVGEGQSIIRKVLIR